MRLTFPLPLLVFAAIALFRGFSPSASGIIDVDYYWHLSYGEWILDHLKLPTEDFWSWSFQGHPYRLTQWLGELMMGIAHRLGGTLGTQWLSALLLTGTLACSYLAARAYLPSRLASLALAFGCDATLISLPCRPHQFTHLCLAALSAILAHYVVTRSRRLLYLLPPLFAIWVNLHGGYAIGLAILWMTTGVYAIQAYLSREPGAIRKTCGALAVFAAASTLATLLNPYGLGAWQYAIDIAQLKSSSAGIVDEWGPTNIKMDVGLNWFIACSIVIAAMATSKTRPSLADLLMATVIMALGWSALRIALMMTILLVPLAASSLRHTPLHALVFEGACDRYEKSWPALRGALVLVAVAVLSFAVGRVDKTAQKYVAENLPQHEVEFIQTHGLSGRIMNNPEIGGYLIRNLRQPVALDTRLDLYGDRALFDFLFARRGDPGWRDYVARTKADLVVLDNVSALRQLMMDTGSYRLVFEGPRYSVLIPAASRPDLPTITPGPGVRATLDLLRS